MSLVRVHFAVVRVCCLLTWWTLVQAEPIAAQVTLLPSGDRSATDSAAVSYFDLQRLAYDNKICEALKLTPDQRRKVLIALEKYRDATLSGSGSQIGEPKSAEEVKQAMDDAIRDANSALTQEQRHELLRLIAEQSRQRSKQSPVRRDETQAQEARSVHSLVNVLTSLASDRNLSETLGLTAEQRVDIKEAKRNYLTARSAIAGTHDLAWFEREHLKLQQQFSLDVQAILTPEQSESLARVVRVKGLVQSHGDGFAMFNGLAQDFGMSGKELLNLRVEIQKVRQEYYHEVSELKKDSFKRIVDLLPPEHREEAQKAVEESLRASFGE